MNRINMLAHLFSIQRSYWSGYKEAIKVVGFTDIFLKLHLDLTLDSVI
jgi:hypothetical protein